VARWSHSWHQDGKSPDLLKIAATYWRKKMRIHEIEIRHVGVPLVRPFRTSFGTQTERDLLVLKVSTDVGDGWAECVAMSEPLYSPEYTHGCEDVLEWQISCNHSWVIKWLRQQLKLLSLMPS
jgi:hypothetical protein